MKLKINVLALAGFIACVSVGFAQDNAATNNTADASASAPGQPDGIVPLISINDLSLNEVIQNLARGANLNYILDPHIPYGQVDPATGKTTPQPTISIRWENITYERALLALLNNYNLVLTEDPKTKISRISLKDPAAPDPLFTKIIQLEYSSPSNVAAAVTAIIDPKRSRVVPDVRTSQLVVLATEKELIAVEELIKRIDTPTKQVLIEARLIETSQNPRTVKGIDWSGTLEAQNLAFGNNLKANPPGVSVNNTLATSGPKMLFDTAKGFNPATAFLDADGVSAVLSFLNKQADAKVIATPRTVTLDNEPANLSVTRAFPIFKNTAGTQGSPGGSEVTYTNLGVILNVTPRISANNYINLHVVPEVSSVFTTIRKIVADTVNEADVYDVRKVETRVMVPSGNTLVMAGLIRDATSKGYTKVPVLGDLPLIGLAFRKEDKSREQANLIIFITPTIVQDADFQPTTTDFLKTKIGEENYEIKESAWDSGKPKEWGKPIYDKDTVGTPKANSKY